MIEGMLAVDKVVPYFDLSFQHAAPAVLRRMRRFGDPNRFWPCSTACAPSRRRRACAAM